MKKIISLALLVVTLFNYSITAEADISKSSTEEIPVSANITPTYMVRIPIEINLGEAAIISATNVLVEQDKAVKVSISQINEGDESFNVKSISGALIEYNIFSQDEITLNLNDEVIFEEDREEVLSVIPHENTKEIYAEDYSGKVVFKISYEGINGEGKKKWKEF